LANDSLSTIKLHRKLSRSKLLTSDEVHIITNYLHLNCTEYGLQKRFNPLQSVPVKRMTFRHSLIMPVNMTQQVMQFVYWLSTYNLPVQNTGLNITWAKSRDLCLLSSYYLSVLNMYWKHDPRIVMK